MKPTGPTDEHVRALIGDLRRVGSQEKSALWNKVASDLAKPRRQRRVVNVALLKRIAHEGETVVVPGKVLGTGALDRKIKVAALAFSTSAMQRIQEAKGECLTIEQVLKTNPKGKNLRIIG